MICLIITVEKKQKVTILEPVVGKEVFIGRDDDCDISLPQANGLSRRHCCIRFAEKEVYISDLGSTNGVYADAVKLEAETPMQEGVKYTLGDAEMLITGLKQYAPKEKTPEQTPKEPQNKAQEINESAVEATERPKAQDKPILTVKKAAKPDKEELAELAASRRVQSLAKQLKKPSVSILELILVLVGAFVVGVFLNSAVTYGDPFTPFKQQDTVTPQPPAPVTATPAIEEPPAQEEEEVSGELEPFTEPEPAPESAPEGQ